MAPACWSGGRAQGIGTDTNWPEQRHWSGGRKAGRRIAAAGFGLDTAVIAVVAEVESVMHAEEEDEDSGEFAIAEA